MSEKTEEASPQKLRKAGEDGDSGQSSVLSQALGFFAAVLLLPGLTAAAAAELASELQLALTSDAQLRASFGLHLIALVLKLSLPLLVVVAAISGIATLLQTGGIVTTKKLVPDIARLNPIDGVKNLFSLQRVFSVVRALLFAALVLYFLKLLLTQHLAALTRLSVSPASVGPLLRELAFSLMTRVALVGLGLGILDVWVSRRGFAKKMRMSKDEVKRERKESDGDPELKAARERAHHEMLTEAVLSNVRHASVVVVNPTHIACALRYDAEQDHAPTVLTSGEGVLAAQIIRRAQEYGIPILRDVPLAHALRELDLGEEIPEILYEAVAEILRDAAEEQAREASDSEPSPPGGVWGPRC